MQLIAMAGLPGTGKSTLAAALARALDAPLLDKDRVRAALFAEGDLEQSHEQDDFCMRVLYRTAVFLAQRGRRRHLILDGRTFGRREQVAELAALAAGLKLPLVFIECTCSDETARERLAAAARAGRLPAANRGLELYERLKAERDALPEPKLIVATDQGRTADHLAACRAFLAGPGADPGSA
jgi:adenylylsulfate kinase